MSTISRAPVKTYINATLSLEGPEVEGQTLTPSQLNAAEVVFTPTSTPPGLHYLVEEILLPSSGAQSQTIDLAAWTDTEGLSKTSYGKKVQVMRVSTLAANSGDFTIAGGDSDAYELFGVGNELDVPPGAEMTLRFGDNLADIGPSSGGGDTDIKFSGTGGDTLTVEMIIG
jgi:hypothetical protein